MRCPPQQPPPRTMLTTIKIANVIQIRFVHSKSGSFHELSMEEVREKTMFGYTTPFGSKGGLL